MNSESYNDGGSEISEYKISSMCKNTASSSVIPIRFSKMNSQPFTRRIFTLCGVCAPPEGSNFQAKFRQIITVLFISVNIQVMELGFILYGLYQLEIGNVFNLLFAVLHVAASNAARLSYITVIPQSKKCRDLFNGLQTISNMCKFRKKFVSIYRVENFQFSDRRTFTVGEKFIFEDKWIVWQNFEMGIDYTSIFLCESSNKSSGGRRDFLLHPWWTRWTKKFVHALENAVLTQIVSESTNNGH